jgi:ribosome-binding factor A
MRKKASASGGASQRQLRVAEAVRQALADMLTRGDVYDETLSRHPVSVTAVRMTPDLKLADVQVLPLGGEHRIAVLAALDANRKAIRAEVAHRVNLKFAPDLRFHADETFDVRTRIERLLDSDVVRRDIAKPKSDDD